MDYVAPILTALLWLTVANNEVECLKVSFYGASYIAMPLQEAKISTNIRFRFRTHQENALIFLAAGRTDYCLLGLTDGRIKFTYKINDHLTELWSPKQLLFNDLKWHDVAIHRYETNISMQINEHFVRKNIPTQIAELNIHFGVFLGGLGDFSESYLLAAENFRGCISDIYYNNINVFKRARERSSHVTSVHVSWSCAAEFDAGAHESVSFIENDALMVLAKPAIQQGESWSLEMRTIELFAIVLYNNGLNPRADFVALEIVEGKIRLLVGKGSNAVELIPDRYVADGKWHTINLSYSPASVEINVDETLSSASFANGSSQVIELDTEFYIGGLETKRQKRASLRGLQAADINFKGCMRNIMIDSQPVGFPHMKITNGVTVDCVWNYPCLEKQPCIYGGTCQHYGIDEFVCHCEQAFCIKNDYSDKYKVFSRSDQPFSVELLGISPLQLLEGDSIFITPIFIDVLFDHSKLGITEGGVLFHVVQPPKHGKIFILPFSGSDSNVSSSKYFSLVDLSTDRVKYVHSGGEHFSDQMAIDLQLVANEGLPDILVGKHRFVLHANITPVNDAPSLIIPGNRILRLTQGIPKLIGADLLSADDPDSPASTLMYTMLAPQDSHGLQGRVEVAGKSVNSFTQAEINQGLVSYQLDSQDTSDISFELALQVSDGMETSAAAFLKVSVLPLQLRMINNTGLIMVHKSHSQISPWNLSFISNSEDENIDVRFDIVQAPAFGSVQKLRLVDASWIPVDTFTSNQIMLGQVRYIHATEFPLHDDFKFTASLGPISTPKYDFRITFTKLKIGIQQHKNIQINGTQEIVITNDILLHQTTPIPTFSRNIIYTVLQPPKYGLIYVDGHPEYAKVMDSFTQQDIDKSLIRYRTHRASYSSFADIFEFVVTVPECEDAIGRIQIFLNPDESLAKLLSYQTREKIFVREGDRTVLTKKNFEVLFNKFESLSFTVTKSPMHGTLCSYDSVHTRINSIESFSLDKLYLGDIYYCHDDSESTWDSFNLLILSGPQHNFQFVCELFADIQLQNDNGPTRFHDNVFHVVRNESKTLSGLDLKYIDPDIDTSPSTILYTDINATNVELIRGGVLVSEFTQDELDMRRIILKNTGGDEGRVSFIVTDGLFEALGSLDVIASDPFLKMHESNASIVQEGKMVLINDADLSVETNLNTKPEEIEYKVLDGPNYGVLKILRRKFNASTLPKGNHTISAKNFTQVDVERDRLVYWNTEIASMDKIRYRVSTKGIWTEGEILVRIYPAAYWDLLQIRRNQTLFVEESTSVVISRNILEIIHPNISPGDITYLVTSSPQHGYLEIQSITSDDEYNCKVFDQSTINSEKMFYIQAGVNQSSDSFSFDVTNGITWLRSLQLKIVIIPENLYMRTQTLVVDEGGTIQLDSAHILPFSEFYIGKIYEYKIVQQPQFGSIKSGKSSKVNRFTQKQLDAGVVFYSHDDSENSTDLIRLVALVKQKESIPFDLHITILPVNDEVPVIATNTGLHTWIGGRTVIKNVDLMAQDLDSPPEALTFIIDQIRGGHLSLRGHLQEKLMAFTQKQINDEEIFFVHDSNHLNGKIKFIVSDGTHNSSMQVLHILTNPVTLEQVKNEVLHVFPLTRKQIMPEQLQFRCTDQEREVKFSVGVRPQIGRILYEYTDSGIAHEVTEFTQSDIDNGKILYEHTQAMVELKTNDSFVFDVTTSLASTLRDQMFHIDVSVSSGGLLRFLPVPRISLDEGETAPIRLDLSKVLEYLETRAGIQAPELYIEAYAPSHGSVEVIEQRKVGTRFTLNDFSAGRVYYRHDHSDSIDDKILMSVFLHPGQIFLCNLTIPVSISPVNDQPFNLVTQSPHISVVEGENRTIGQMELLTEDADTPAKDIIYDIISGPTLGVLMKMSDEGGMPQDIIAYGNQFTQLDINEGKIIYAHTGSPQSTTFYFKVSDGKFKPAYEIFNIKIMPINIYAGHQTEPLMIVQGATTALLHLKNIVVDTNIDKNRLMYNITSTPTGGVISVGNKPVLRFNHRHLRDNKVIYSQTDMTKSNDTFRLNVFIPDTHYATAVDIKVFVQPQILINAISIPYGEKIRLSSNLASEAPEQMKMNRYNPKITIIKKPKIGKLKKIVRSSGETESLKDKEISSFTYRELKSGVVYFVARKQNDDFESVQDSFEYLLTLKSMQPAQAVVSVDIHSNSGARFGTENEVTSATSTFPFKYLLVLCVAVTIVVLVLLLVLLLRCCRKQLKADKDPPHLPQPPDLMTMNQNQLYASSDNDSIPVTTSSTPLPVLSNIPHCKVTAIGLDNSMHDQIPDSDQDDIQHSIMGYPYGDEPEDWSSSYDFGNDVHYSSFAQPQMPQPNPLLRRNQYWV